MSLTFQFEPLAKLLDEGIRAVVDQHWREIALDQIAVPLSVDWASHLAKEKAGTWKVFTARRSADLVGYIALHMYYPDRYTNTLFVQEDTIFILPNEKNRGVIWAHLWRELVNVLPSGCKIQAKIRTTAKEGRAGAILERLGMKHIENIYSFVKP